MLLTVVGKDLPGRTCATKGATYTSVRVGVQRGRDAEQWFPADASAVGWTLELSAKDGPDVRGPHVQGRPGARFFYLVWSGVDSKGTEGMFRRLKVPLEPTASLLGDALHKDTSLTVEVSLTGRDGTARCGGLKTHDVTWALTKARDKTGTT